MANWRIWVILLYPYWQLYGELGIESIDGKLVILTTVCLFIASARRIVKQTKKHFFTNSKPFFIANKFGCQCYGFQQAVNVKEMIVSLDRCFYQSCQMFLRSKRLPFLRANSLIIKTQIACVDPVFRPFVVGK